MHIPYHATYCDECEELTPHNWDDCLTCTVCGNEITDDDDT
jgi:hypothetical protein